MTRTSYIFCVLLVAATSCSKSLDTKPTSSIDQTEALKTSDDVSVALVGAYHDMGSANLYGGGAAVTAELLGDYNELNWTGTFQGMTQIKNKDIPVDNYFITGTWLDAYKAINDVNNILASLDVVDAASRDRVEGEAKFIRAACYFELVRLYGKSWNDGDPKSNPGVPLVFKPTGSVGEADKVSRSSVAEVYTQVLKDLSDAEAKLPSENGFYANRAAAAGLIARVALQQGDHTTAAAAADRAINAVLAAGGGLARSYAAAFPNPYPPAPVSNTLEDVFAIQVNTSSGTNSFQTFFSALGRGDIQIKDAHLALYEPGDDRLSLFYTSGGSVFTGKFDNVYGNVHVIRLAEMYLTRAEANFRNSSAVGATPLEDINTLRKRVGLPDLSQGQLDLNAILSERKLELAFEGFNLHDIKRTKDAVGSLSYNSPKLVFPIPKREITVNPNLVQNEGY